MPIKKISRELVPNIIVGIRENQEALGLSTSDSFYNFIDCNFNFYSRQYIKLLQVSRKMTPGFEFIFYNWNHGFTLQYMLLLAPLKPDDQEHVINLKLLLVSRFVDILLAWRIWNYRSVAYSTMQYAMFLVMRDIRGLDAKALAQKLLDVLAKEDETFASNDKLRMHQQNKWYLHRILARITDYIEQQSGNPSHYIDYIINTSKNRFEVEHIWADKPDRHVAEFNNPNDFKDYRNHIGGLLLLPKSFNGSYGALTFEEKLPHYISQNILARSLNQACYHHNPGFLKFIQQSKLPFKSYDHFTRADLDERHELYRQIATQIWNPELIGIEAGL